MSSKGYFIGGPMTSKIELLDKKRKSYRKGYVIGFFVFLVTWFARSAMKTLDIGSNSLHDGLLAVLILVALVQAYYVRKETRLKDEFRNDKLVAEALNDELVQLNELKAWRIAFFSLIGYIMLLAVLSFFVEFNDLMMLLITAILIGFGTYNAAVYFLNR